MPRNIFLKGFFGASAFLFGQTSFATTEWLEKISHKSVFLVMNKDLGQLRFHSLIDGQLLGQLRAISGLNPGDKSVEGDRKTPEGIYTVMREIPKSTLASLHGAAAYELNYPNFFDKMEKKAGSGIWIHGVEKEDRLQKGTDTRGCVALSNLDVVAIKKLLNFGQTPVLVVDKENAEKSIGYENNSGPYTERLQAWANAWSSKNSANYISFYHPQFKSKGMDYAAWNKYKERLTRAYKSIQVKISNVKVLVHPKYSVAYFVQDYLSDRLHSVSQKRVYLVGPPQSAAILSEDVIVEGLSPVPTPTLQSADENLALSQNQKTE